MGLFALDFFGSLLDLVLIHDRIQLRRLVNIFTFFFGGPGQRLPKPLLPSLYGLVFAFTNGLEKRSLLRLIEKSTLFHIKSKKNAEQKNAGAFSLTPVKTT